MNVPVVLQAKREQPGILKLKVTREDPEDGSRSVNDLTETFYVTGVIIKAY